MMDEALLRPGRLEVHVEISLPNEEGRVEIINIHTKKMREKGYLDPKVSVPDLAKQTKNYSGAEIEGVVRSATSFALNRQVNVEDLAKPKEMTEIKVFPSDFEHALDEVRPKFGQHEDDFEQCIMRGIIPFSDEFGRTMETCQSLVEQVNSSENTPLLAALLSGPPGCGKTALAAHIAKISDYPYVRRVGPENY